MCEVGKRPIDPNRKSKRPIASSAKTSSFSSSCLPVLPTVVSLSKKGGGKEKKSEAKRTKKETEEQKSERILNRELLMARSRALAHQDIVCFVDESFVSSSKPFCDRLFKLMRENDQQVQSRSLGCSFCVRWKKTSGEHQNGNSSNVEAYPYALVWVPGADFVRMADDGSLVSFATQVKLLS